MNKKNNVVNLNNVKLIGNKVYVPSNMKKEALRLAKEINNAASTGSGTTSISKIADPNMGALMGGLEKRIVIKATSKIDEKKLERILVAEKSFSEEVLSLPEIQKVANIKPSLRFTYIDMILRKKFGRPTKAQIWSILKEFKLSATDPGADNVEEIKALSKDDADFLANFTMFYLTDREGREGKNKGGKPTVLIDSTCKTLNKNSKNKGIDVEFIANPLDKDYESRGLIKPYKGKKAADFLISYTDKTGEKIGISGEYFGWTGATYERNIVQKGKEIANNMGHQYAIFGPNHADNEAASKKYSGDIFEREGMDERMSNLEKKTYIWVLTNDKYVGKTEEDAIYNGFYGILKELGIAKKIMPASKTELFSRKEDL